MPRQMHPDVHAMYLARIIDGALPSASHCAVSAGEDDIDRQ